MLAEVVSFGVTVVARLKIDPPSPSF